MLYLYIWIACGGAFGAIARYLLSVSMDGNTTATLCANVCGCLFIGFLMPYLASNLHPNANAFWSLGFCGAFTTFSTLSLELVQMLLHQQWSDAGQYFGITLVGGVVAICIGHFLGTRIWGGDL